MIIYKVEITVEAGIELEWLDWMKQVHVPDVVRTGCFTECRIYKVIESDAADPVYVMQYHCPSLEEYHRYRDNFVPAPSEGAFRQVCRAVSRCSPAPRGDRAQNWK